MGLSHHSEQCVEILDARFLDRCRLRDSGVRHKDIQSVADNAAHFPRQLVRAVRGRKIGTHHLGSAAGGADFLHHRLRLPRRHGRNDQDLRACFGQRQRTGAADAARSAGHERGLALQVFSQEADIVVSLKIAVLRRQCHAPAKLAMPGRHQCRRL